MKSSYTLFSSNWHMSCSLNIQVFWVLRNCKKKYWNWKVRRVRCRCLVKGMLKVTYNILIMCLKRVIRQCKTSICLRNQRVLWFNRCIWILIFSQMWSTVVAAPPNQILKNIIKNYQVLDKWKQINLIIPTGRKIEQNQEL